MFLFECSQFAKCLFDVGTINFYQLLLWGFIGFTSVIYEILTEAFRIKPQFFTMTLKSLLYLAPACPFNLISALPIFFLWVFFVFVICFFSAISPLPLQGLCTCCFLSPERLWLYCRILLDIYPTCHLLKEPELTTQTRASPWSISLAQQPDHFCHSPHHNVYQFGNLLSYCCLSPGGSQGGKELLPIIRWAFRVHYCHLGRRARDVWAIPLIEGLLVLWSRNAIYRNRM